MLKVNQQVNRYPHIKRLYLQEEKTDYAQFFSNFARTFVVKNGFVFAVLLEPRLRCVRREQNSKNKSILHSKCTRKIVEERLEYSDQAF